MQHHISGNRFFKNESERQEFIRLFKAYQENSPEYSPQRDRIDSKYFINRALVNRLSTFRSSVHYKRGSNQNRDDSFNISEIDSSPLKKVNPMDETSGDFMQGNNMLAAAREEARKHGYIQENNYRLTVHRAGPNQGVGGILASNMPGAAQVTTLSPRNNEIKIKVKK